MDKKSLKIVVEVLDNASINYLQAAKYVEK